MQSKIDVMGRIVIPHKIRKKYGFTIGENVIITETENGFEVANEKEKCKCCNGTEEILNIEGKSFCKECYIKLLSHFEKVIGNQ